MKHGNGYRALAMAGIFTAAVVIGCQPPTAAPLAELPPVPVTIARPIDREVVEYRYYTGRLEAVSSVDVKARVSGYLEKVAFVEGAEVKQGDVLFEIDPRPFQADVDRVEAQLARDEARVRKSNADFARNQALYSRGVLSREDYDKSLAERDEALASVAADKAALARARLDLEFSRVTAPITGRAGRALITEGNLITAGPAGSPVLTTIVPQNPLYLFFNPSERDVIRFLRNARKDRINPANIREAEIRVEMGLADSEDYPYVGTVNFAENQVDPSTGTITVRAQFDNAEGLLTPGFFARVRVPDREPHRALLVPARSLMSDQERRFVWTVGDDGKVGRKEVTVGPQFDRLREVLRGLEPTDWILVDGMARVREGAKVEARRVSLDPAGEVITSKPDPTPPTVPDVAPVAKD